MGTSQNAKKIAIIIKKLIKKNQIFLKYKEIQNAKLQSHTVYD
jgi:hypothetical protein